MKWTETHLLSEDLSRVVSRLHESRIIQKVDVKNRSVASQTVSMEVKSSIDKWLEFLEDLEKPTKGLLASLSSPHMKRFRIKDSQLKGSARSYLSDLEKDAKPIEEGLRRISEDISRIEELSGRFKQLSGLELDLRAMDNVSLTRIKLGITRSYGELKEAMEEAGASMDSSLIDKKEGAHAVMIIYTRGQSAKVESKLRGRIFTEIVLDTGEIIGFMKSIGVRDEILSSTPAKILPELDRAIKRKRSERKQLREKGAHLADKYLGELRAYEEAFDIMGSRESFSSSTPKTDYTAQITGWVEADRIGELEALLKEECGGCFSLSARAPTEKEEKENSIPTKQSNGWLGSLFESMTNTFSPPRYNEIDPSVWISVPFILFFGLMLGDAGYGLIIIAASIFILKKIEGSKFMKTVGKMGLLMGIATTIAGVWMGAFFGDLIPRVILGDPNEPLYSLSLLGIDFPYDTLRSPMILFQISLYLGLLQLNIGLFLLGYDRYRKGDYFGVIKGAVSWIFIQIGGTIFIGSIIVGWFDLNGVLAITGGVSFLLGVVLLFFESKGMFFFDIEGYMGDWISYTRILALGLSTFGLAMAFNIIGDMLLGLAGYAMVVIVIPLLIILHVFNLLLQTLGSVVHSLRLQFVEFFGRFYEGGGHLFDPFGRERLYTIKEGERSPGRGGN